MAILIVLVLLVAACGGDDAATTTGPTTTTAPPTTTTSEAATTTTVATTTSTVAETTTTSLPIDVFYEGGQVVGEERFTFTVGGQVSVWVLSDVAAEIHVHGYDIFFMAEAGVPIDVSFTADVPGIFEVELEETHTPLFELEVTP